MNLIIITGKIIKLNRAKTEGIIQNSKEKKIKFKFTQDNIRPIFLYGYYKFKGLFSENIFIVNEVFDAVEETTIDEITELFPSLEHNDLEKIHKTFGTLKIGDFLNLTDDFINTSIQVLGEKKGEIFINSLNNIKSNQEYMDVWKLFNETNTTIDIGTVIKIANALKFRASLNQISVDRLIKQNPWIIVQADIFDSVSQAFKIANNIADYLGYHRNDNKVVISYAIAVTNMYMQNSHSYIPYYTLLNRVSKLTKIERKTITNILNSENNNTKIGYLIKYNKYNNEVTEEYKKHAKNSRITPLQYPGYSMYIPKIFYMERYIAQTLAKILKSNTSISIEQRKIGKNIEDFMKSNEVILTNEQKEAILSIADNKITVINGGAGTGKSMVIKAIKEILKNTGYNPVILAPTGVASQRVAPNEGATIHRYAHIFDDGDSVFDSIEEDKNKADNIEDNEKVIIVDEMSMITVPVFAKLLSVTSNAKAFIFVGDSNQLPPIGAGGVFEALIEVGKKGIKNIKTVSLNRAFRSTNSILKNAENILNNEGIFEDENLHIVEANDWNEISQKVLDILNQLINNGVKYTDIMVLSNKRGENKSGTSLLNEVIREKIFGINADIKYSVGDIVITTRNDYDSNTIYIKNKVLKKYLSSLRKNSNRPTIFNGTIGIIDSIKDNKVFIKYENPVTILAEYDIEELDWYIEYGFAVTVHKAQGGQAKYIIFATDEPEKISREMLYTVLTRSQNGKVFLIGGKKENWNIKRTPNFIFSKLKYKILDELNLREQSNYINLTEKHKKVILID